jgi:hypothetical protein
LRRTRSSASLSFARSGSAREACELADISRSLSAIEWRGHRAQRLPRCPIGTERVDAGSNRWRYRNFLAACVAPSCSHESRFVGRERSERHAIAVEFVVFTHGMDCRNPVDIAALLSSRQTAPMSSRLPPHPRRARSTSNGAVMMQPAAERTSAPLLRNRRPRCYRSPRSPAPSLLCWSCP